MTSGADFTQALTGEESGSKTGLGVFGEAYWNGGWVMLVTGCLYVGILFALFCYVSMRLLMNQEYVYIPVIMIGVLIGLRPDDWFVPTFVGGIIEAICLFMILHVLHLCLRAISPVRLVR
jgi:hypothetical protein